MSCSSVINEIFDQRKPSRLHSNQLTIYHPQSLTAKHWQQITMKVQDLARKDSLDFATFLISVLILHYLPHLTVCTTFLTKPSGTYDKYLKLNFSSVLWKALQGQPQTSPGGDETCCFMLLEVCALLACLVCYKQKEWVEGVKDMLLSVQ